MGHTGHMDRSVGGLTGEHVLSVPADLSRIASLRNRVSDVARAEGAEDSVVGDLTLVVSELATNVVQHSDASQISLVLRHEPGRWVLEVDDAGDEDTLDPDSPPDPEALSGRGLFIVQAIMDEVESVERGGSRFLRCIKLVG